MNSQEVATYFRNLSNEGDLSFLDNAQLAVMLTQAHKEFRRLVTKIDESYYEATYNVTPTSDSLSLNNVLFGQTPSVARATRLVRVTFNTTSPGRPFQATASYEALHQCPYDAYWLQGNTLRFNRVIATPITITYIPAQSFAWNTGISAATFIEDLAEEFGDLIALLAYNQYAIQNYASNPWQAQQAAVRTRDLSQHLMATRSGNAAQYVQETNEGW